ncbi:hypothetical protein SAY86_026134 [Trapa natans]|uniref:Uncharacterized protein n=1 Tax=Trapa natans TaxID=22666 RepID=A0AAN7KHE8_TRANT|nr:hypothetical protein SAY86_026134 [Trapa natans]
MERLNYQSHYSFLKIIMPRCKTFPAPKWFTGSERLENSRNLGIILVEIRIYFRIPGDSNYHKSCVPTLSFFIINGCILKNVGSIWYIRMGKLIEQKKEWVKRGIFNKPPKSRESRKLLESWRGFSFRHSRYTS